jgi:hypothetical protein
MMIDSASLPSVQRGRRGVVVFVDDDALGIAKQLEEMKFPEGFGHLRLGWNEYREEFVVIQIQPDGSEHLVTRAEKADGRLLKRVREITHPSYDYAADLERIDAEADARLKWDFSQQVGDKAERLAHAIRKDTQTQNRIFLPNGISER